ncbi:sensor histidine kinase [Mangrovimonas spongiae]|uniref:histidine kinase n=1 Tax=Mangrovimonas spongiae TaxID=2494697 RepID=A0A3R9NWR2_9FLAO|nr:sensor histidine kinase [Mangrovimonas spongiae]RSK39313.1 sensor histidine kinase [Mangrovimonas spongiae]
MAHLRAAIDAYLQEQEPVELHHIKQALVNSKLLPKTDISKIVTILTNAYAVGTFARQDQLQKSDQILAQLQRDSSYINNTPFLKTYFTFGKAHNDLKHCNTKTAEKAILQLLPELKQAEEVLNILQAHHTLATIYEQQQENKKALTYYKSYLHIKDSLNKSASKKRFAYVQTQFEVEKKDLEIEKQQKNILLLSAQNKVKNQGIIFGAIFLIALFTIFYLWRSRKFTKHKMKLQKNFAQDLISNVEAERKRISSELHDSIGQNLLLIKNKVILNPESPKDTTLIDHTIDEVRHMSQHLHPFQFEKLGLIASIKNTVENFQKNSNIFYSEDIDIQDLNISKDKEIFIYRMIQECLNNVEKHSQAKACNVMVKEAEKYVLFQIKDNGIGFDLTENSQLLNSLGMKTLKERAQIIQAQLSINSEKGKGTTIQIQVPKK